VGWYVPQPVPPSLAGDLVCGWSASVEGTHTLVPDGCIDILRTSHGAVAFCGPETRGWTFTLPAGTRAVGVRFRPGVIADALRVDVAELRDRRVAAGDLLGARAGRELAERLDAPDSDDARLRVLEQAAALWHDRVESPDRLVRGLAQALGRRAWDVHELAEAASLSERQLHRRCRAAFGYGPSTLRAVLRLQRFMDMARRAPNLGLAELAQRTGFSDQAHLARQCRRVAGMTPTELLAGEAPDWHGGGAPWWETPDVRSVQDARRAASAGWPI
jgi:AraC-like DNA-binding protein